MDVENGHVKCAQHVTISLLYDKFCAVLLFAALLVALLVRKLFKSGRYYCLKCSVLVTGIEELSTVIFHR